MNSRATADRAVAITGVGAVTNCGKGFAPAWDAQLTGAIHVRQRGGPGRPAGTTVTTQAPPLADLLPHLPKPEFPRPTRATAMALLAAREAWQISRVQQSAEPARVGVMISRIFGEADVQEQYYATLHSKGPGAVSGLMFVQSLANTVLGRVALELEARGPSVLHLGPAIFETALDTLRRNEADVIVVGGLDHLPDFVCDLCDAASLSRASAGLPEEPRPYEAGGIVPGDGAAFLVLERPDFARAREVCPLAYLRGAASVADPGAFADPMARSHDAITEVIIRALEDASTEREAIGVVSGAANGLARYDDAEAAAVGHLFGARTVLFSSKSTHGETWGAAAPLALASAIQTLATGAVPRSLASGRTAARLTGPRASALALSSDLPNSLSAFVVEVR